MTTISSENKSISLKRILLAILASGLVMWLVGGLYHNLILPAFNENIQPHHEGLGITLIAYFILALLMTYLYSIANFKDVTLYKAVGLGAFVGILWVFPHGLAMAGTHQTSIAYEVKNTLYHVVEQGIGGLVIFYVCSLFGKYN